MIPSPSVHDASATNRERRLAAAYLAAWVPYGFFYASMSAYVGEAADRVALIGAVRFVSGAALGLGIRWLSARLPWPERGRLRFAAAHLAAAQAFGLALVGSASIVFAWYEGKSVAASFAGTRRYLPFELMMDTFLYGLVAGACYTIRSQQRAREERLNALRAEAAASRAQLSALRAQLNPHFLFNALHSLGALVRHDTDRTEEALERLGGLLRYALDEGGERVPLAREWDFVRDYLQLEQLRLGDRLRVEESCDPEARAVLVPPFALQPLVENAIRHGIAQSPAGGRVCVTARVQGERLTMQVEDDGLGCDPGAWAHAAGLGLRSLRERLAASYRDAARLEVVTSPGAGFRVSIELPTRGAAA
jgi:signal transduction histidine kinase